MTSNIKRLKKVRPIEESEAIQKIMYWFFSYPNKEFSLTDLVNQLKISKTTANRIVADFIKVGFLNKEIIGRIWRIKCNQKHEYNLTKKMPYNLELI